ncbi:MAG: hypothetical protein M1436_08530 [Acidobacteria bacterium]|nr:hypothetical protein [Acidobacteriota bacterium]
MIWIVALGLVGLGLCRAALSRYRQKEDAIRAACRQELQKLGLTRDAAKARYFTPEISMASTGCLLPGSVGDAVVRGKFAPGTQFVFENDNLEVVKETLSGNEYHATLKAAPGIGPETAAVTAITPVTGLTARTDRAARVGGKYEWTMNAENGWKIVARSPANKVCGGQSSGEDSYEMAFYRANEASPFEKRGASLYFNLYDRSNYRFTVSQQSAQAQGGMQEFAALMQKMTDPSLSSEQRERLMKDLQKMQGQMQANLARMADPANIQKMQQQQQQFGCDSISLEQQGQNLTGEMRCSETVGRRVKLTGTLKFLGR